MTVAENATEDTSLVVTFEDKNVFCGDEPLVDEKLEDPFAEILLRPAVLLYLLMENHVPLIDKSSE